MRNDESHSSDTDSDQDGERRSLRRKTRRQQHSSEERDSGSSDEAFDFTADNLIERPGQFLSSLLT